MEDDDRDDRREEPRSIGDAAEEGTKLYIGNLSYNVRYNIQYIYHLFIILYFTCGS